MGGAGQYFILNSIQYFEKIAVWTKSPFKQSKQCKLNLRGGGIDVNVESIELVNVSLVSIVSFFLRLIKI